MKKITLIAFVAMIFAACTEKQKDFSYLKTGMTKSDVVLAVGEPQKKNDIAVAELWVYPASDRTVVFRNDTVYDIITSGEARVDSIKMSMDRIADDVDRGLEKTGDSFDSIANRVKKGIDTLRKK